jgi:biotin synthase-like enzyme
MDHKFETYPPSERKPHVFILDLTQGCDYQKCTFCDFYGEGNYKVKSIEDFKIDMIKSIDDHFKNYPEVFSLQDRRIQLFRTHFADAIENPDKYDSGFAPYGWRVFLGGGNALGVEQEELIQIFNIINSTLGPERISLYGRTDSIIEKEARGLWQLRKLGLRMIYWGVESGSTEVLEYVNKGYTYEDLIKAGKIVNAVGIGLSVMVMPGLGGIKFNEQHTENTIKVLNEIQPKYVTFMGVNPSPNTLYAKRIAAEANNRPLTDLEMVEQLESIIEGIEEYKGRFGCFPRHIDRIAHNPVTFSNTTFTHKYPALGACNSFISFITGLSEYERKAEKNEKMEKFYKKLIKNLVERTSRYPWEMDSIDVIMEKINWKNLDDDTKEKYVSLFVDGVSALMSRDEICIKVLSHLAKKDKKLIEKKVPIFVKNLQDWSCMKILSHFSENNLDLLAKEEYIEQFMKAVEEWYNLEKTDSDRRRNSNGYWCTYVLENIAEEYPELIADREEYVDLLEMGLEIEGTKDRCASVLKKIESALNKIVPFSSVIPW